MVPHIKKLLGAIHKQRFIIAIFRGGGGRIRRRSWSKNSFDISIGLNEAFPSPYYSI